MASSATFGHDVETGLRLLMLPQVSMYTETVGIIEFLGVVMYIDHQKKKDKKLPYATLCRLQWAFVALMARQ